MHLRRQLRYQPAQPVVVSDAHDVAPEQVVRPLRRLGEIDQPHPFILQRNSEQRRQRKTGGVKDKAGFPVSLAETPCAGVHAAPGQPVSGDDRRADGVAVRIDVAKNVYQGSLPVKGSTQAGRKVRTA